MNNIINFPIKQSEPQNDVVREIEEVEMLSMEHEKFNDSKHKCCKCNKNNEDYLNDQFWCINQLAGYGSELDGQFLEILICDKCLIKFLNKKIESRKFKARVLNSS